MRFVKNANEGYNFFLFLVGIAWEPPQNLLYPTSPQHLPNAEFTQLLTVCGELARQTMRES